MATAYRRKRLMEGIISGDKEVQAQIASISDKQNMDALQQSKAAGVCVRACVLCSSGEGADAA